MPRHAAHRPEHRTVLNAPPPYLLIDHPVPRSRIVETLIRVSLLEEEIAITTVLSHGFTICAHEQCDNEGISQATPGRMSHPLSGEL